jgi:hypothetical protein
MVKEGIDGDRVFVIRNFCSTEECDAFVAQSERTGYGDATINTAIGVFVDKTIRDNARVLLDDVALAANLWERLRPFVPATIDEWRAEGLNERFRFYRYDPGQKFLPHFDGYHERSHCARSQLTFMVYLNDDFTGGETNFFGADVSQRRASIHPERGMALVFAHLQLHEGASVMSGRKYVLRSDVMYERADASVA